MSGAPCTFPNWLPVLLKTHTRLCVCVYGYVSVVLFDTAVSIQQFICCRNVCFGGRHIGVSVSLSLSISALQQREAHRQIEWANEYASRA